MTLSRKTILCDLALLCGLLVLGLTALWGLTGLLRHQHTTADEYAELRQIGATRSHLAAAEAC